MRPAGSGLPSYVDLYTSRLDNFLQYPVNYKFLPHRHALPHEPRARLLDIII